MHSLSYTRLHLSKLPATKPKQYRMYSTSRAPTPLASLILLCCWCQAQCPYSLVRGRVAAFPPLLPK